MLEQRIQQHFIDSADLQYQAAQVLGAPIAAAVQALLACVTGGAKVLACGAGPSAAQAGQFAAFFVDGWERERPGLAALALQPMAEDDPQALARQVRALGLAGDMLLVMEAGGAAAGALREAVYAAQERDMTVLVLCGRGQAQEWGQALRETDVLISVPHERAARVREVHALVLHCLCDGVDAQLLGESELEVS